MDLQANIKSEILLNPLDRVLVPTGLFTEIPENVEAQIRPRSGLALKYGITVLNSPGTIDADYRGEIGVLLINLSQTPYSIKPGDKIAQMVFSQVIKVNLQMNNEISATPRGQGGFGSTGK